MLRNCIIENIRTKIPAEKVLGSLVVIDVIILKINNHDVDNIFGNINDLRENILYMRSFTKLQNMVEKNSLDEEN